MLVQKNILIKKLIIYLIIMALALGGVGYFLFKNWRTSQPSPPANYQAADDLAAEGLAGRSEAKPPIDQSANNPQSDLSRPGVRAAASDFDITVFSNEKFKALEEYAPPYHGQTDLGNKNPFKITN